MISHFPDGVIADFIVAQKKEMATEWTIKPGELSSPSPILILMFGDFTWKRIGREKFTLSLNIIAQTLELELD